MRRVWQIGLILVAIVVVTITSLIFLRGSLIAMLLPPALAPGIAYPPAPKMPPPVPTPIADLLAAYETILSNRAPDILAALQPGLTDAQIDELSSKHKFTLPPDLRALYRWRNGSPRTNLLYAFAGHRFIPLNEALANRDQRERELSEMNAAERLLFSAYTAHRNPWIDVIVDFAGDGYFWDPTRSEAQGSFFFCFNETGSYLFFPTFRNFLAATVEGHQSGILSFGEQGAETVDFEKAHILWRRFGADNNPVREDAP